MSHRHLKGLTFRLQLILLVLTLLELFGKFFYFCLAVLLIMLEYCDLSI
jgi:hypothetical protein